MNNQQTPTPQAQSSADMFGVFGQSMEYAIDAAQRTVLFWDVLRQRGKTHQQRGEQ